MEGDATPYHWLLVAHQKFEMRLERARREGERAERERGRTLVRTSGTRGTR